MTDYPDFTYRGDVDIIAQTITRLSVDIAAQTLTALGINITAQDLAELVIKIHAQDVGVYVERDWAAKEDEDKSLTGSSAVDYDAGEVNVFTYTVSANREVYIDDISISVNGDYINVWLKEDTTTRWQMAVYKESPYAQVFTTPKKFVAGEIINIIAEFVAASGTATVKTNLGGREYVV